MRNRNGCDTDLRIELYRFIRGQLTELNVFQVDEQAPGTVRLEEVLHARHDVRGDLFRGHHFAPQIDESGVMSNVGMRQKDAIDSQAGFDRKLSIECLQLLFEVRSAFDEPTPA